jgi:hypothetical protein
MSSKPSAGGNGRIGYWRDSSVACFSFLFSGFFGAAGSPRRCAHGRYITSRDTIFYGRTRTAAGPAATYLNEHFRGSI